MVLEELHQLIETLQERIAEHAPELKKDETRTRYALIDPLLRVLGWDVSDPSQVIPEFAVSSASANTKRADYALLGEDGRPAVIVEAKSLETNLQSAASQALNYCNENGFAHFAVTDGCSWRVYDTFQRVPLEKKLIAQFKINDSAASVALAALALWRPAVAAGAVQAATEPVAQPQANPSPAGIPASPLPAIVESAPPPQESGTQPIAYDWQPLSEFRPDRRGRPAAIRLPNGVEKDTKGWGRYIAELVSWLSKEGYLTSDLLPIRNANGKHVVSLKSTPPQHPSGQPVRHQREAGQYLINANFIGSSNASHARLIITTAGQNPANFGVKPRVLVT